MPIPSLPSIGPQIGDSSRIGTFDPFDTFSKTWHDNLSDASFRGVKFKISSSETTIGRRTKLTELNTEKSSALDRRIYRRRAQNPQFGLRTIHTTEVVGVEKNAAIVQDLGRQPEKFEVDAFVIQNSENGYDYFTERDNLIRALNTYGPGLLVHPFYGELDVYVEKEIKITESFKEGGIAKFKICFVESPEGDAVNLESIVADWNFRITNIADLANALGLDSLAGVISGVMDAVALAKGCMMALKYIVKGIQSIKGAISSVVAAASGFVTGIMDNIDSILDAPCDIIVAVKQGIGVFKGTVGLSGEMVSGGIIGGCSGTKRSNHDQYILTGEAIPSGLGISVVDSMLDMADITPSDLGQTTSPAGTIAQTVLYNTINFFTYTTIIQIAIKISFGNKEEMLGTLQKIVDGMDAFLDALGRQSADMKNDDIFTAMQDIRAEFILAMNGLNQDLVQVTSYTTTQDPPPVLVLAYDWYENIYRDQEIIDLNHPLIRHPGFPPQGVDIKMLAS